MMLRRCYRGSLRPDPEGGGEDSTEHAGAGYKPGAVSVMGDDRTQRERPSPRFYRGLPLREAENPAFFTAAMS